MKVDKKLFKCQIHISLFISHPILDLHYSITGDAILIISGTAQVILTPYQKG